MKSRRLFRNFIINEYFQWKFIGWHILFSGITTITYGGFFYFYTKENYNTLVDLSGISIEVKQQLYKELTEIILILGSMSFFFLATVILISLIFSHRIAGPLYQLKIACEKIAQGDKKVRVKFRENDEFKDLEKSFNNMLDKIDS